MIKQTLQEWREEAKQHFGEDGSKWRFKCSSCGHVQCGQDFIDKCGMEHAKAKISVYQECIGRHADGTGCNWAAYGFLGTVGKGRVVITPKGDEVEVFDFAD